MLILTTNHIENLDEALIRAGRVDKRVEFRFADREQIVILFTNMYDPSRRSDIVAQKYDKETISALAEQFADQIDEGFFSPAALQGFVIEHKSSPESAVREIAEWVREKKLEAQKKDETMGKGDSGIEGYVNVRSFLERNDPPMYQRTSTGQSEFPQE